MMHPISFVVVALLLLGCTSQVIEPQAPQNANEVSQPPALAQAPNFTLHVLYFYRESCQFCAQSTPTVDALRASYTGKNVVIDYYNVEQGTENRALYGRLADVYNISKEGQVVPLVFIDGEYLAGYDRINQYLEQEIKACLEAKCPDPHDALTNASIAKPI
jgi:glutaredoxin